MTDRELPLLGGISYFLSWLEDLVVMLSGPLLLVGLGIGLVSLFTDGALLVTDPWLIYAWALSQTVGVDGQLVGAWYRVSVAVSRHQWAVVIGFALLGLGLAYVGFIGSWIFLDQQTYHLTAQQALAQLGINDTAWLWQRAVVSVLLVCLSGYLRYRAPDRNAAALDEKAKLERELELAPLKARLNAMRAKNARELFNTVLDRAKPSDLALSVPQWQLSREAIAETAPIETEDTGRRPEPPDDEPPPGQPVSDQTQDVEGETEGGQITRQLRIVPASHRRKAANGKASRRQPKMTPQEARRSAAFTWLNEHPGMTQDELRAHLKCRGETAKALYAEWQYSRPKAERKQG